MTLAANLDSSRYQWGEVVVKELLALAPSNLVLDIGAGDERMQSIVRACGARTIPFDLVPRSSETRIWNLDTPPLQTWERGGIALLLDVIEHLNNPALALKHVAEMLDPGGFLVITTPNPRWSRSRLFNLVKGTPICFTPSDLDTNRHVYTPWPHIIERQLHEAGFTIKEYVTLDGQTHAPPPWPILTYPVRLFLAGIMKVIERVDPTACGMSYGLLAQKSLDS